MRFHSGLLPHVENLANGTKNQFIYAKEHIMQHYPEYKGAIEELYQIRFETKVQAVNNLTESGDAVMRNALVSLDTQIASLQALRESLAQNFFIDGGPEASKKKVAEPVKPAAPAKEPVEPKKPAAKKAATKKSTTKKRK